MAPTPAAWPPARERRGRLPPVRRQELDHQLADRRRVPDPGAKDDAGDIRGFILDRGMQGLSTERIDGKFSLRASITGTIAMDEVFVPQDRMLPHVKGCAALSMPEQGAPTSWGTLGAAGSLPAPGARLRAGAHAEVRAAAGLEPAGPEETGRHGNRNHTIACRPACRSRPDGPGTRLTEAISIIKRNNCGKALEISRVARDMLAPTARSDEYHHPAQINLEAVNTPMKARTTSTP